jgi:adenylylsulfate reductase subunit B
MPPVIDKNKCIACQQCSEICSQDVFYGSPAGAIPEVAYPEECWHCNLCIEACPEPGAIKLRIPLSMLAVYKESAQ